MPDNDFGPVQIEAAGLSVLRYGPPSFTRAILLCHGFGANAFDLLPLASVLSSASRENMEPAWFFPQAPIDMAFTGLPGGRAWFPHDRNAMQSALSGSYFHNLPEQTAPGLEESGDMLLSGIEEQKLDMGNLVLGGFSQGAMVALDAALRAKVKPRALLILSGAMINRKRWSGLIEQSAQFPVYQSHGKADPVLRPDHAKELSETLKQAGFPLTFRDFSGGHEIPDVVLADLNAFLRTNLS
jgi:phospholipase/carboxylesterase